MQWRKPALGLLAAGILFVAGFLIVTSSLRRTANVPRLIATAGSWSALEDACDAWEARCRWQFGRVAPFCRRRNAQETQEVAVEHLTDPQARMRYVLCRTPTGPDWTTLYRQLPEGTLTCQTEMLSWGQTEVVDAFSRCVYRYFSERYPDKYGAYDQDASRPEYFEFVRAFAQQLVGAFDTYDPQGKSRLLTLLHDLLERGVVLSDLPVDLQQAVTATLRGLLPPPGGRLSDREAVRLYRHALGFLSHSHDAALFPSFVDFIENYAHDKEYYELFEGLFTLRPPMEQMEPFLIKALHDPPRTEALDAPRWSAKRQAVLLWLCMDPGAPYHSETLREAILPFVSAEEHSATYVHAASAIMRMPGFQERYARLLRETQVLLIVSCYYGVPADDNDPLRDRTIYADDAPVLAKLLDPRRLQECAVPLLQVGLILHDSIKGEATVRQTTRTGDPVAVPLHARPCLVRAAVTLAGEFVARKLGQGHGPTYGRIYGQFLEYFEGLSGQRFWDASYGHELTSEGWTQAEMDETWSKVQRWWEANQDKYPPE